MDAKGQRYVFLDGLRGLAAAAVMYAHFFLTRFANPLPQAAYAVDFFFILSGFVLAHAYAEKLRSGSLSASAFMIIRYLRLAPMLIFALTTAFLLHLALAILGKETRTVTSLFGSYVLGWVALPNLDHDTSLAAFPLIGPEWSLCFEFIINFLFAVALKTMWRFGAFILTTAFVILYVCAAIRGFGLAGSDSDSIWFGIPRVLFGFTAGVALWFLPKGILQRMPLIVAMPLTCALVGFVFAPFVLALSVRIIGVVIVFPLTIALGSRLALDGIWMKVSREAGYISYPLYILHYPLVGLFASLNRHLAIHQGPPIVIVILVEGLVIMWLARTASDHLDDPIREAIRAIISRAIVTWRRFWTRSDV